MLICLLFRLGSYLFDSLRVFGWGWGFLIPILTGTVTGSAGDPVLHPMVFRGGGDRGAGLMVHRLLVGMVVGVQATGDYGVPVVLHPQVAVDEGIVEAHSYLALQLLIAAIQSIGNRLDDLGLSQRMIRIRDHLQDVAEQVRDELASWCPVVAAVQHPGTGIGVLIPGFRWRTES